MSLKTSTLPPRLSARTMFWSGLILLGVWLAVQLLIALIGFVVSAMPVLAYGPSGVPFLGAVAELSLVLGAVLVGASLVTRALEPQQG
ncbi:hypothetical protein [Agromyces sp. Marseille-Q5079]|uniref:hypothetical protein n=1 Tax=Agromyces sp. Marseille-Q5079 TaxID=3439059 RepID=UPI003D9CAC15